MPKICPMGNTTNITASVKFNVTFGIVSRDEIPANAAVLLNECKKRIDGELQPVTEFLAVEGVRSTKNTDLLIPILAVMVADAKGRNGFKSEFRYCILNGVKTETGLGARTRFTKYLKGNVVYKSNSEGKLNKALVLDEGLKLSNTALKVSERQAIFKAEGKELQSIMIQTSHAICKQASLCSNILKQASAIYVTTYDKSGKAEVGKIEEKAA